MRPARQLAEPALLLRLGAVFGEDADRAEIAELHHVGATRAHRGDLLDGDHRIHQGAALPAVALRQRDAHQALLGHELRHVIREARIVRAFERASGEMSLCKAPHLVSK